MKRQYLAPLFVALAACSGGSEQSRIPGYLTSDACNDFGDPDSCAAGGCAWAGIEACPDGTDCPEGVCYQPDPCTAHDDADSCAADAENGCQWAEVDLLCPPDADCAGGGFCSGGGGGTDECVCVCPLYCPEGEDCPPCDCTCPPPDDGGGGGTCTCACPDCPEGETCPPCDCTCEDTGGGCTDDGTCTCVCPECPPDTTCEPCACDCDASTTPPESDAPTPPDPCTDHLDEVSCADDTANECMWYALGIPCMEGEECVSGVCQGPGSGDGDDCTCYCPECDAEPCPLSPCYCECGTGSGCVEPEPV